MAEDSIKDSTYNMPPAVVAAMGVDEATKKMETPVQPEVLAAFKKAHPAPFWLFGEDRQLAVRNNIIPAHWFEDGAKQWGKFSGEARPGEFYVFQVCVIAGKETLCPVPSICKISLGDASIDTINESISCMAAGSVQPIWFGVQIPEGVKPGTYDGTVTIAADENINIPNGPADPKQELSLSH